MENGKKLPCKKNTTGYVFESYEEDDKNNDKQIALRQNA